MLTLLGLVLIGIVVAALLLGGDPGTTPAALGSEPGAAPAPSVSPPAVATPPTEPTEPGRGRGAAAELDPAAARAARFDGRGTLRGEVLATHGAELPERFTVVLEPSQWLIGKERAVSRQVEVRGSASFEVADLPFGGYDVHAEAAGLNGPARGVLLQRGSASPHVQLEVRPAGFLDGGVLRADGSPAEDLRITLEAADGSRARTTTDAGGNFVFRSVLDGSYRLLLGPPAKPLLPPSELSFRAPSMRFPTQTLPETIHLQVQAMDESGRPIEGALVRGYGDAGGSFEERTGTGGFVEVPYMPPGRIRIAARTDDGRQGRATTVAPEGGTHQVRVRLR